MSETDMLFELEAFHLETPAGFRFCVLRRPIEGGLNRGTIIHVPAFADEMNKSRHMVALAADAWARDGWNVLQLDLGGCGDSEGEFADASWDGWLEDVRLAHQWVQSREEGPIWLWGMRLGALLASEAAARFRLDCGLLLWQPVLSGKQHLTQFLRLWLAAQVMGKVVATAETSPQQRLAAGETVEIAGYEIGPRLAYGMESAQITVAAPLRGVHWFQISASVAPVNLAAVERLKGQWQQLGVDVVVHMAEGPSFWQVQEIEIAHDLLDLSRNALRKQQEIRR